jgi:hypothetical protein
MRVRPLSGKPLLRRLARRTQRGGQVVDAAFDPASLFDSDTGFVFDLSDADTVFQEVAGTTTPSTNGDPIGTLLDLSGNDNHVDAIDTSLRPNYVFDGSVGYADFNATAALDLLQKAFTLAQPTTFIISIRVAASADNYIMDGGTAFMASLVAATGSDIAFFAGTTLSGPSITVDENFVVTVIANSSSSKLAVNAGAFSEGDAGTNDAGGITFGSDGNGGSPTPMRLYRAIGIGRILTDPEIADARAWCAAPAGVSL